MKLTFVIPAYNAAHYIGRCLDSILNQVENYRDQIEILVINDGSTDETDLIVNRYCASHSFINLYFQDQQGAWKARNLGIEKSKGEFIWFIDADDEIGETSISNFFKKIKIVNTDVFFLPYNKCNRVGTLIRSYDDVTKGWAESRINLQREVWNKIYRKSFILKSRIRFDNLRYNEDTLFNFKLFCNNPKTCYLLGCRYIYYVNPDSMMNKEGTALRRFHSSILFVEYANQYIKQFPSMDISHKKAMMSIILDECDEHILGYLFHSRSFGLCEKVIADLKRNCLYPTRIKHLNPLSYLLNIEFVLHCSLKYDWVYNSINLIIAGQNVDK